MLLAALKTVIPHPFTPQNRRPPPHQQTYTTDLSLLPHLQK